MKMMYCWTLFFTYRRFFILFMAFEEGTDRCENELFSKHPINVEIRIRECVFCLSQTLIKHMSLYLLIIFNSHSWIKNEMKNQKENVNDQFICLIHH
jgi:hypothetical protein